MKVALFANTDWYLYNFRSDLARAIREHAELVLISPAGEYVEKLENAGFEHEAIAIGRGVGSAITDAVAVKALARVLDKHKVSLLHTFTLKCVLVGALAQRISVSRPACVHAMAGMGFMYSAQSPLYRIIRGAMSASFKALIRQERSIVIVQNHADRNELVALGVEEARIRVIRGSGVDPSIFRRDMGRNETPVKVLMATRLIWDKGVSEYVQAAKAIREKHGPRVEFLLAGSRDPGNPRSLSERDVKIIERGEHIALLGHVADMPSLLSSVDIVVLPTRYREGVPRILIEAGAAEVPVVCSDMPGCLELVEDSVNGVVVPRGDVNSLIQSISRLIAEPDTRRRMGVSGRQIVERGFSAQSVIKDTLTVYRDLGVPIGSQVQSVLGSV